MERLFGLIGHPLGHSFSKNFFKDFFKNNNLPYKYQNFDIENLNSFAEIIANPLIFGLNVTIPFKQKVIKYLDIIDKDAKQIGAVNTILVTRKKDKIVTTGFNTDYLAFQTSLKKFINTKNINALVLGSGGASRAIIYALNLSGIKSTIVSRKPKKGQLGYSDINKDVISNNQLIINTTPVGMYPDIIQSPELPYQYISKNHFLYDLIYNPDETLFLKNGKSKGATIKNGIEMLELQALYAWEIWNK